MEEDSLPLQIRRTSQSLCAPCISSGSSQPVERDVCVCVFVCLCVCVCVWGGVPVMVGAVLLIGGMWGYPGGGPIREEMFCLESMYMFPVGEQVQGQRLTVRFVVPKFSHACVSSWNASWDHVRTQTHARTYTHAFTGIARLRHSTHGMTCLFYIMILSHTSGFLHTQHLFEHSDTHIFTHIYTHTVYHILTFFFYFTLRFSSCLATATRDMMCFDPSGSES